MRRTLARPLILTLALALSAAIATAPTTAAAQDAEPSAEDKALAEQLYDKASDAYSTGDYQQAIEWLERAYSLDPDPVILYSLGRSYEGAGSLKEAKEALQTVLDSPRVEDDLKKRARTDLKRVENLIAGTSKLGQITINTSPADARVFIDGREEGTTPFAGSLETGPHTILLQKDGYESVEQDVEITADEPVGLELTLNSLGGPSADGMDGRMIGAIVSLSVGAIGIGTGVALFAAAKSKHDQFIADGCDGPHLVDVHQDCNDTADSGSALSAGSIAGYSVGGVGLAVGTGLLVWALVDDGGSEVAPDAGASLAPAHIGVDPLHGAVNLRWHF